MIFVAQQMPWSGPPISAANFDDCRSIGGAAECKLINLSGFDTLLTDPSLEISVAGELRRARLREAKCNGIDNND
jgi:hypothetical protein